VTAALLPALSDSDARVRVVAAGSLQKVSPAAAVKAGVIPVLIRILEDEDDQIAYRAVEILGHYAEEPEMTVPALLAALHHESSLIRSHAAMALGSFPAHSAEIVPILQADHDSEEAKIPRWASGRALRKLGPAPTEVP
jgi:HEAT repeat protein